MSATRDPMGIGGRLGLAFGLSALLSILACVIGWLSYARVGEAVRHVAREELPAAASAAEIAKLAGGVSALAPLLLQSRSRDQIEQLSAQLAARLGEIRAALPQVRAATGLRLAGIVTRLEQNAQAIRQETLEAIALAARTDALLRELRALHSDFVDEADPLIEDARFLTRSLTERLQNAQGPTRAPLDDLRRAIATSQTIQAISSQTNLSVGQLSRIAAISTLDQLAVEEHILSESIEALRRQLDDMTQAPEFVSLRQILARIIDISNEQSGLPTTRTQEIGRQLALDGLLAGNRALLSELDEGVSQVVNGAVSGSTVSVQSISATLDVGRNLLVMIALLAVVASASMAITYVRGHLMARIQQLAGHARTLAAGQIPPPIEVTGHDELTDMAQAMENFRRTQNELVQSAKLAALGHLSAGLAHELNQPLNAIRAQAYSARLMQQRGDHDGAGRAMEKVQALTQRASQIVAHLKRFVRRGALELKDTAVSAAIDGALLIVAPRLKQLGVRLTRKDAGALRVMADEIRLEQVLVNLISNAADAVEGRETRLIHVGVTQAHNLVRITVEDSGGGIDPAVAETLFDPFASTKAPGAGLGLGLTISHSIVSDFGGALTVQPGAQGARFTIELQAAGGG